MAIPLKSNRLLREEFFSRFGFIGFLTTNICKELLDAPTIGLVSTCIFEDNLCKTIRIIRASV
jgi:hypothetical protein